MLKTDSQSTPGVDYEPVARLISPATILSDLKAYLARKSSGGTENEIGDIIAINGGVLTDDLERRIGRKFMR